MNPNKKGVAEAAKDFRTDGWQLVVDGKPAHWRALLWTPDAFYFRHHPASTQRHAPPPASCRWQQGFEDYYW